MALVSIIVPIYNMEKYLKRSITCLMEQTLENIEIILVNDGSSDQSLDICNEYASIDSRIIVINQENQGVSKARNTGIHAAKSEYIAFMDPDDAIDTRMYELLYFDIVKTKSDFVLCNYSDIKGKKIDVMLPYTSQLYGKEKTKELLLEFIGPKSLRNPILGSACRGLYKKSILIENDIFFPVNISFMEDLIFNINYLLHINNFYVNSQCLYYYYENVNSSVTAYKSNLIIKENEVFDYMVQFLIENNLYFNAVTRLANRRAKSIIAIVSNEAKKENPLPLKKRLEIIKSQLYSPKNIEYLQNLNTKNSSVKEKVIGYMLKKRKVRLLYLARRIQIMVQL